MVDHCWLAPSQALASFYSPETPAQRIVLPVVGCVSAALTGKTVGIPTGSSDLGNSSVDDFRLSSRVTPGHVELTNPAKTVLHNKILAKNTM